MLTLQTFGRSFGQSGAGIGGRQAKAADRRRLDSQADESALLFDCDGALRHGDNHDLERFAWPVRARTAPRLA